MLTPAQWASIARVFIQWACVYLVSRGLITAEQAEYVSDPEMLAIIFGGIGAIVTLVAGVYARRPAALVKEAIKAEPAVMVSEVSKLPDVEVVQAAPGLAHAANSPKVVTAEAGVPFQQ